MNKLTLRNFISLRAYHHTDASDRLQPRSFG